MGLCMISIIDCTSANGSFRSIVKTEFCVLPGTEDCSSINATAEPATSSNDDLSVHSVTGNRISAGGSVTEAASPPDETRGDLSTAHVCGLDCDWNVNLWGVLYFCTMIAL